jgi:hypothetical protein
MPTYGLTMHEKALTESLLTVDCKNTVLRPAQIQLSATGAMKSNRTKGSTKHA